MQLGIDWTPSGRELMRSAGRRDSRRARMLDRLKAGPANTWEMMLLGGAGFSSRIRELRDEGWDIQTEGGPDVYVYRLGGK